MTSLLDLDLSYQEDNIYNMLVKSQSQLYIVLEELHKVSTSPGLDLDPIAKEIREKLEELSNNIQARISELEKTT